MLHINARSGDSYWVSFRPIPKVQITPGNADAPNNKG
jgi:hypothetical protein